MRAPLRSAPNGNDGDRPTPDERSLSRAIPAIAHLSQAQQDAAEIDGALARDIANLRTDWSRGRKEDNATHAAQHLALSKSLHRVTGLVLAGIVAILSSGVEGKAGPVTVSSTLLILLVAIVAPERLRSAVKGTAAEKILDAAEGPAADGPASGDKKGPP